jgi:hypothetical protein
MDSKKIEKFWWMLGLTNMMHKACIGKSGGIALFWRNGVDVIIHTMSKYFIDVMITSDEASWQLSRLYGEPNLDKKDITWRALHVLNSRPVPWLCMGDFNEVLFQYEKQGGAARLQRCMGMFKEALEDCGMEDLGYSGDMFTWCNHHHNVEGYIRERLDRAVANWEWMEMFSGYEVTNGEQRHSDHRPIIFSLEGRKKHTNKSAEATFFQVQSAMATRGRVC